MSIIDDKIALLFKDLTSPETNVVFDRATPDTIKSNINPDPTANTSPFELSTGASDAPAYHDFFRLQIAFEDVWEELLDTKLGIMGQLLYAHYDALMGTALTDPTTFPLDPHTGKPPQEVRGVKELEDFIKFVKDQYGLSGTSAQPSPPALLVQTASAVADAIDASVNAWNSADPNRLPIQIKDPVTGQTLAPWKYMQNLQGRAAALRNAANAAPSNIAPPQNVTVDDLKDVLTKLDAMLSETYRFDVFAPNSINYGLVLNYRQRWEPQSYQVGNLVSTIPLAPQEVRKYTAWHVVKRTRNVKEIDDNLRDSKDEQAETARADSEIVQRSRHQSNFQMNASESFGNDAMFKVSAGQQSGQDQAVESAQTKREFRESVLKSSQEYRNQHRMEITTEEVTEDETTESREIRNPNDELTVTYLFYELQRRYTVDEHLHRVTPVILVANSVPAPSDVDIPWLLRHDWILRRAILDKSFLPALEYLSASFTANELNIKVLGLAVEDQRRVVLDISQQVSVANDALNAAGLRLSGAESKEVGDLQAKETASLVKSFFDPLNIINTGNQDGNADRAAVDFAKDALDRAQAKMTRLLSQLKAETTALHAAIDKFTKANSDHFTMLTAIDRLRIHVKDNIIYYMQAIWSYEPVDQRLFRLYNVPVPVFTHNTNVSISESAGLGLLDSERNTYEVALPSPQPDVSGTLLLHQVADIETLLGFKGNYMIFPLVNFNYMVWFMMQDYLQVDENGVVARDPDEVGALTIQQLQDAMASLLKTKGPGQFDKLRPMFQKLMEQLLSREQPDMVIVPSNSLYIEALPGTHPLLEDFKLIHRAVDVKKAQAEDRKAELENLRRAARLQAQQLGDPDIEKIVYVADGTNVTVDG